MKVFDFLRKSRFENGQHTSGSYFPTNISDTDLRDLIKKAISIFQENPNASGEQIIALIQSIRDEEMLAIALYRFIPTAYCRLFISEMNYSDSYILIEYGLLHSCHLPGN